MDNKNINKIKSFALDLLFPKFCLGCQKEGTYLCFDCKHLLEIAEFDYCLCEQNPVKIFSPSTSSGQTAKCSRCQSKKLSGLYFGLSYKEKSLTRKLIHNFKYAPFIKELAKPLSDILIEHFILTGNNTDDIWENSILIPVPLHAKKQKERGYNQSEELAKELAKVLKVPVVSNLLVKIKNTPSQMKLKKEERQKNLQGAFDIIEKNKNTIKNKKIFLVDDVYTTGITMQECAGVLLKAGAKQVWGIAIAREG